MKFKMGLIAGICLLTTTLSAQNYTANYAGEPGFALYINSPIGLISKMRIKAEMRFDNNLSIMGSFSSYHNMWAGNQSYLEMRRYKIKPLAKQTYQFARIGSGQTIGGNYFLAAFKCTTASFADEVAGPS